MTTYSTSSPLIPARSIAPAMALPPSSTALSFDNSPCRRPNGVRAPATITASAISPPRFSAPGRPPLHVCFSIYPRVVEVSVAFVTGSVTHFGMRLSTIAHSHPTLMESPLEYDEDSPDHPSRDDRSSLQ